MMEPAVNIITIFRDAMNVSVYVVEERVIDSLVDDALLELMDVSGNRYYYRPMRGTEDLVLKEIVENINQN